MKFVTLKTLDKKKILITTLIVTSLILVITIFVSHASFTSTDHVTIVDGVINYTPYDFKILGIYQKDGEDYTEVEVMPGKGYTVNVDKTYCYVDLDDEDNQIKNKIYTNSAGEHVIKELPKRSKCIIYFDKEKSPSEKTLAQLTTLNKDLVSKGNTAHFTGTSCSDGCSLTENGIYEAADENGTTSYYFRGTVENNYVKFGKTDVEIWFKNKYSWGSPKNYSSQEECESDTGYSTNACIKLYGYNEDIWWRIIRINGDGSIRMIYAGTSTNGNAPAQTGAGTMIGSYKFNNSSDQAEYVGYQYTLGEKNGHTTDSNAKTVLEKWFADNLIDEYNAGYIDKNAGFCGDRTAYDYATYERNDSLGTGTQKTNYGGYIRTARTHEPTFLCEDKEHDLYTVQEASEGTQSLTYPIGLTTIDEQVYAGNYWLESNTKYYLYNNQSYWTMSPFDFAGSSTGVFSVNSRSSFTRDIVGNAFGLRPVLNLVSDYINNGNGTANCPFEYCAVGTQCNVCAKNPGGIITDVT